MRDESKLRNTGGIEERKEKKKVERGFLTSKGGYTTKHATYITRTYRERWEIRDTERENRKVEEMTIVGRNRK
jgi:hypothetical protein